MIFDRYLSVVSLSLLLSVPACAQIATERIVRDAFPGDLADADDGRFSTFVEADLRHDGRPMIVALYSNGSRAAVRVLDQSGEVVAAPDVFGMKGFRGELELVDIDHDQVPEVVVRLFAGHGLPVPDTWIFRWTESGLKLISPTKHVGSLELTQFGQIAFVDFNGDGRLDVLAFPPPNDSDGRSAVFQLENETYAPLNSSFIVAQTYVRHTGRPEARRRTFASAAGAAMLHVLHDGVTSAHVTMNGTEVVGPSDFRKNARRVDMPVTLALSNTLSITLDGEPERRLWILIEPPKTP